MITRRNWGARRPLLPSRSLSTPSYERGQIRSHGAQARSVCLFRHILNSGKALRHLPANPGRGRGDLSKDVSIETGNGNLVGCGTPSWAWTTIEVVHYPGGEAVAGLGQSWSARSPELAQPGLVRCRCRSDWRCGARNSDLAAQVLHCCFLLRKVDSASRNVSVVLRRQKSNVEPPET